MLFVTFILELFWSFVNVINVLGSESARNLGKSTVKPEPANKIFHIKERDLKWPIMCLISENVTGESADF